MIEASEAILSQILGAIRSLSDRIDRLAPAPTTPEPETQNVPQSVEVSNRVSVHWHDALPVSVDLTNPQPDRYLPIRLTDGSSYLGYPFAVQAAREPTFIASFYRIPTGLNRRIATLFNGSTTHLVRVWEVRIRDYQETAVTGVPVFGDLSYMVNMSGGNPIAVQTLDVVDALPAGIEVREGATGLDFGAPIVHWAGSSEELVATTGALQALLAVLGNVVYRADAPLKPITLVPSMGLSLVQRTNSTVGTISGTILFSVVPI